LGEARPLPSPVRLHLIMPNSATRTAPVRPSRSGSAHPARPGQRHTVGLGRLAGIVLVSSITSVASAAESTTTKTPAQAPNPELSPQAPEQGATYSILSFQVAGSSRLSSDQIRTALRDAVGPAVNLSRIRQSLLRLQQAYRDAGLPRAAVILPRQPLTNGIVQVRVIEDSATTDPSREIPGWSVPTYEVSHFLIQGNNKLSAEEIDQALGDAAGSHVSPAQLQTALRRLREAYVVRGYSNAVVQAPSQVLTDGTISLRVIEGPLAIAVAPTTNALPVPAFEVRRYEVQGNTLLTPEQLGSVLAVGIGDQVTLPQIQKALGDLQLAYRERGWATVGVALPQQQLTNAVVRVEVTEGALTEIQITGNRHFSSNNVMRSLPSLRTNTLLNSRVFQRELDIANQNRDRQIYPVIGPGPDPGTSALTLRVKDRLPLHGRVEVNNQSPPATPEWRINSSVQFRNLWQREHQVGFSYGFSPEAYKNPTPDLDFLLNRPLVAFYGGYYRLPLGEPESVDEQIRANRAFGFDEASRQYRLPPAGAQPDLTFFASAASTDTGVQFTPGRVVSETPLLTIVSRDSGRNVIGIESGGTRFGLPVVIDDRRRVSLSAGIEAKHFAVESFNTNNFIITTVVTNAQGSQVIRSDVASPQPTRASGVTYLPLTLAADYSQTDTSGSTALSLTLTGNFIGNSDDFDRTAYSTRANPAFAKAVLAFRREQKLVREWAASLRAVGQVATAPLLPTEQLPLGGMNSVRGYFEGDDIGDMGWSAGLDLLSPQFKFQFGSIGEPVPSWIRGFTFFDAGQRFQVDGSVTAVDTRTLWSVGFGLSANINNLLDLRVTVGLPLADSLNRDALSPRANVSVGGQF